MDVTVALASDSNEADDIQARLAEAGIASNLEPADEAANWPAGDGPCRVVVPADLAEVALDVLASVVEDDDEESTDW